MAEKIVKEICESSYRKAAAVSDMEALVRKRLKTIWQSAENGAGHNVRRSKKMRRTDIACRAKQHTPTPKMQKRFTTEKRELARTADCYGIDRIEKRIFNGTVYGQSQNTRAHYQLDIFHRNKAVLQAIRHPEARQAIFRRKYQKHWTTLRHSQTAQRKKLKARIY